MEDTKVRKPFEVYLLVFLVFFQAVGAIYGGLTLVIDPTGGLLQMPLTSLEGAPFKNYLIPGLILLIFLGLLPSFLLYPLIFKPEWIRADILNIYKEQHWSLTYSLYLGIMLIIWIDVQIMILGYGAIIQSVYAFLGVVITIVSLLPGIKRYYSRYNI
jgi:hypothetical protein